MTLSFCQNPPNRKPRTLHDRSDHLCPSRVIGCDGLTWSSLCSRPFQEPTVRAAGGAVPVHLLGDAQPVPQLCPLPHPQPGAPTGPHLPQPQVTHTHTHTHRQLVSPTSPDLPQSQVTHTQTQTRVAYKPSPTLTAANLRCVCVCVDKTLPALQPASGSV